MDCFPLLQTNDMFIGDITIHFRLVCFETWEAIHQRKKDGSHQGRGVGVEGDLQLIL